MEHQPARRRSSQRTGDNPVRDAALGLLRAKPHTAPELAAELKGLGMDAISNDCLDRSLAELARWGLIRRAAARRTLSSKRGRLKVLYRATPAGVAYVRKWMGSELPKPRLRHELVLRIAVCGQSDLPLLIDLVIDLERSYVERIRELDEEVKGGMERAPAGLDDDWQSTRQLLSERARMAQWRAQVAWLKNTHEMLAQRLLPAD